VTANVVWYAVKRCARQAGIPNLAPHDLRRTCARLCHDSSPAISFSTAPEPYVDVKRAASYLSVAVKTLNEWARLEKIPVYPWGGRQQEDLALQILCRNLHAKPKVPKLFFQHVGLNPEAVPPHCCVLICSLMTASQPFKRNGLSP
jgi:hypothetical protein